MPFFLFFMPEWNFIPVFLTGMSSSRDKISSRQERVNTKRHYFTIDRDEISREISSRDETLPGMKSCLSMVKCLLLITRFCRDEISSPHELIPFKKTGMKFHPGMKKRKKTCKHFILGWNFKMSMFFLIFDVCIQICFRNLRCLNIMKIWI